MKLLFIALVITVIAGWAAPFAMDAQGSNPSAAAQPTAPKVVEEGSFMNQIANIYTLGLALVGISALLYITWGGIEYIFAGENSSMVGTAKGRIKNALWGIAIAALSYAILNTINPDLVCMKRISDTAKCLQQSK